MADAAPHSRRRRRRADIEAARGRLARRAGVSRRPQLVLLGGRYVAELSDPAAGRRHACGGRRGRESRVDDPLAALNEALSPAGCTISVARGARVAEPITIMHLDERRQSPVRSIRATAIVGRRRGARPRSSRRSRAPMPSVQRNTATMMTLGRAPGRSTSRSSGTGRAACRDPDLRNGGGGAN